VPAVHDQALGADRSGGGELLLEQLAAGNPDPVVWGRHVDHVRRVHVGVDARGREGRADLIGFAVAGERRGLPALRVPEEELRDFGAGCLGGGEWVGVV
jgi:hypothetical protein